MGGGGGGQFYNGASRPVNFLFLWIPAGSSVSSETTTVIHSCQLFFFLFLKAGQRQRPCQAETNGIESE